MNPFRSIYILLSSLFLLTCTSKIGFTQGRDSVTIITISDTNLLPKNAVIQRLPKKTLIDSSRFVKKQIVKDDAEKPKSYGTFKVNKSMYGSYTDYIIDFVKNYHMNHGERIARITSRNKGYFALIDNVMKRYGLPREMKSLAIIESAMNCNAVSPVGAVGPWQFMAETAKGLGLRVDENIDERRDFYKSTNAAARYLKKLHGMFHDWLLVIASYNCGPAPVLRAINSGLGRSFWDIKPKLPRETQNHVMAFIATSTCIDKLSNVLGLGDIPKGAKSPKADFSGISKSTDNLGEDVVEAVVNDPSKPKFTPEEFEKMAVLKVKGSYALKTIARILEEDLVRLKRWNPTFDEEINANPSPIHLRIPMNKLEQFIIQKEKIISDSRKGI